MTVSQRLGRGAQSLGASVLSAVYWGALEGLGGKAGSEGLLHPRLPTGTILLHSIISPNPFLPTQPPQPLPSTPHVPPLLFSGTQGTPERQEPGTGPGDTAGVQHPCAPSGTSCM